MKLPRRNFLHLAAGAAALPAVSRVARAQTYPTRPVKIVKLEIRIPISGAGDKKKQGFVARLSGAGDKKSKVLLRVSG
jgi:hypothetical protein